MYINLVSFKLFSMKPVFYKKFCDAFFIFKSSQCCKPCRHI